MTNAFDPNRPPRFLNGAAMSLFERLDPMPPSPPCPRCGMSMWFSRLEPHPTDYATVDNVTFQCACGELLTQPQPR